MPAAIGLQREFDGNVNVLLVERAHTIDDVRELATRKAWLDTSAMWTTERPFLTAIPTIPNYVILSPEGEVTMLGDPIEDIDSIKRYLYTTRH